MRSTPQRLPLERAVHVAIAVTVLAFVCGSASVPAIAEVGRTARWLALFGLLGLSALYALARPDRPRLPLAGFVAAALLVELAFVSALWSVDPKLTLARATSLAVLFATAALLAYATAGRPEAIAGVLGGLVAGAVLAASAGLALLALRPDDAVVPATVEYPARYRGLGGNPNTVPMLLALAIPIAGMLLVGRRDRRGRLALLAVLTLLAGSIVASASRGALVAAVAALVLSGLLALGRWRARLAAAAAAAAAFALALAVIQLPKPLAQSVARVGGSTDVSVPPYLDGELHRRLEDDIGHPPFGKTGPIERRSLLASSGRAEAWRGAIEQGLERPVAGYGFGTEDRVFVDRYFTFQGGLPENSYIGVFLQLGAAGLVLFLLLPAVFVLGFARVLGQIDRERRLLGFACGGALVAGLVLALGQSYVFSVGNNATAAFWIAAFLLPAAAVAKEGRARG